MMDEFTEQGKFQWPSKNLTHINWKDTEKLSLENFIELLKHLHIIAPLHEPFFFMPCALARTNPEETEPSRLSENDLPPLLFTFTGHCCPIGLFCFLSAYLINNSEKNDWTVLEECIYRSSIAFRVDMRTVTLKFKQAFLEVSVKHSDCYIPKSLEQTCVDVKKCISDAIKEVMDQLNYVHNQDTYKCTLYCMCQDKEPHPATKLTYYDDVKATCECAKGCCNAPEYWHYWFPRQGVSYIIAKM